MIKIKETDDWMEIYIDGEKKYENHDISAKDLLELLNIPFETEWYEPCDQCGTDCGGSCIS